MLQHQKVAQKLGTTPVMMEQTAQLERVPGHCQIAHEEGQRCVAVAQELLHLYAKKNFVISTCYTLSRTQWPSKMLRAHLVFMECHSKRFFILLCSSSLWQVLSSTLWLTFSMSTMQFSRGQQK